MATWPSSLPQNFLVGGFSASTRSATIKTNMDAGPPKTRPRYSKEMRVYQGKMRMTFDQKTILDNFYASDLSNGSLSFSFKDPISKDDIVIRFVDPPKYNTEGGQYLLVDIAFEEIPQ